MKKVRLISTIVNGEHRITLDFDGRTTNKLFPLNNYKVYEYEFEDASMDDMIVSAMCIAEDVYEKMGYSEAEAMSKVISNYIKSLSLSKNIITI